jgi:hypothetical protein
VRTEIEGRHPLAVTDLSISGEDVIEIMRAKGLVDADFRGDERVGEALRFSLERVLDDPAHNDRDRLRALVGDYFDARKDAR